MQPFSCIKVNAFGYARFPADSERHPLLCLHAAFSCDAGEFLEMSAQECTQCAAGSFSLGSGVRFDQWDSMPVGFSSLATSLTNGPQGDDTLTCNR